jgi:hypothetical protein
MDKFVTLTVVTTGEDITERFNVREPLKVVFNRALQAVGGGANRDQFTLEFNDQPLDLERRIEEFVTELGWADGTVLELVPRPEVV